MKPIPVIKKELDRNGVIGFLSITKEKLSNFFNRTFIDSNELGEPTKKRKSRTTKNSRRASLDSHSFNGKVVKAKAKLNGATKKAKKSELALNGTLEHGNSNNHNDHHGTKKDKASSITNGHHSSSPAKTSANSPVKSGSHSPIKTSPSRVSPTRSTSGSSPVRSASGSSPTKSEKSDKPKKQRKSVSPEKKNSSNDLKSSTKDKEKDKTVKVKDKEKDKTDKVKDKDKTDKVKEKEKDKTDKVKDKVKSKKVRTNRSFDEQKHRKFCSTKCNVTNFDDLNELQLELERRLFAIEKYKQTLEFERIRLDKATTDISNFLISKPKAKFAKLRSIILGGDSDWDSQLRPPPRVNKSQRFVRKAIQSPHNAFTPLYSLTLSTKAASNYLTSPRIINKFQAPSVEYLKKIVKNFDRLPTNDQLITPFYKPVFTDCQQAFADFVKLLSDSKLEDVYSAQTIISIWKDQTELYKSLVSSSKLNNLNDFKSLLLELEIQTKSNITSNINGNMKVKKEENHDDELCSSKKKCRQNDGSPSILRQLLSTPPKPSPFLNDSGMMPNSIVDSLGRVSGTSNSNISPVRKSECSLVKLNFAQLDDIRRQTNVLLGKIRDFAHEFAPSCKALLNGQIYEQSQTIFSNICADIDSTAKMCSFMNGNLPIFTSNCLGCQPLTSQSHHSQQQQHHHQQPPPTPSSSSSSSSHRLYSAMSSTASSSSYPPSCSPCSTSTPLWTSSTCSSQSSSSTMSTFSSSVASANTVTSADSSHLRLMRHCGELCGALSPEPIQTLENAEEFARPKKWKWRSKKRSSPKKSRRRKAQSELIRKRKSPVRHRLRITDDESEEEEEEEDMAFSYDDFDDVQLLDMNDIEINEGQQNDPDLDVFVESFNMRANFLEIVDDCCDGDPGVFNRNSITRLVPPFMLDNVGHSNKKFNKNSAATKATTTAAVELSSSTSSCLSSNMANFASNNTTAAACSTGIVDAAAAAASTAPGGGSLIGKTKRKATTLNNGGPPAEVKTKNTTSETKSALTLQSLSTTTLAQSGVGCGDSVSTSHVQPTELLDSVICRLVEEHLIPLFNRNRRQIEHLNEALSREHDRQQKLSNLRVDYVELLDSIYKYLIKNRAILKKDSDIFCKSIDRFIQLATDLQAPEPWISYEDYGENFYDNDFINDLSFMFKTPDDDLSLAFNLDSVQISHSITTAGQNNCSDYCSSIQQQLEDPKACLNDDHTTTINNLLNIKT